MSEREHVYYLTAKLVSDEPAELLSDPALVAHTLRGLFFPPGTTVTVDGMELTAQTPLPAYKPTPRLRACVEAWPDCIEGDYHPSCCRFPKSCSCTVYHKKYLKPGDLETDPR